jgi:hypothetical protein
MIREKAVNAIDKVSYDEKERSGGLNALNNAMQNLSKVENAVNNLYRIITEGNIPTGNIPTAEEKTSVCMQHMPLATLLEEGPAYIESHIEYTISKLEDIVQKLN